MSKNKTAQLFLLSGWGILLFLGVILAWKWQSLPPQLPWFYSLPVGEQQLISKEILAAILAGTAGVLGLTRLIAAWAGKGDIPVETTIMGGIWLTVVLLALSYIRMMFIFLI